MNKISFLHNYFVSAMLCIACLLVSESCNKPGGNNTEPPPPPSVISFTPASAAKDSTVVISITGGSFSTTASENIVTFNGVAATVTAATAASLTVKVPLHAKDGKITVKTNGNTLNSDNDFTYIYTVRSVAGNGTADFANGTGTAAKFNGPRGVVVDASGNIYVADFYNYRIRKVTATGEVSTLAGSGIIGFFDYPTGAFAQFNLPSGVVADASGNIYVADRFNHRIRKIVTSSGTMSVSTLAGDGVAAWKDGTGTAAEFNNPYGVAIDGSGNIYVADNVNNRIRKVTPAGVVSTVAGDGTAAWKDGTGTAAQFKSPTGVALDGSGNIYVADFGNNRIRKITPAGVVSTIAGDGTNSFRDGQGIAAQFNGSIGIATDVSGNVYVADYYNHRIRKITPAGVVSTIAGNTTGAFKDGTGTAAQFNFPTGVATDVSGNIYVADYSNHRIRKLE